MAGGGAQKILAPVADMFNHGLPQDLIQKFDQASNSFTLEARKDVAKGEQVRVSYGTPYTSAKLFADYGFVPMNQQNADSKAIVLTLGAKPGDRYVQNKRNMLHA